MDTPDTVTLKRSLSLTVLTLYGLGTIIGAGIYVLVGKVSGHAGMYAPLAFFIAALIAAATAFTYAELSSRYPISAGEAVYADHAFGSKWLSTLVGLALILLGLVSTATLANGFVGYFQEFFSVPDWLVITVLVFAAGAVSAWGINESAVTASVLTLVEITGLLIILWVSREAVFTQPLSLGEFIPPADILVWQGVLLGSFLAFYAFIGFEDMVNVAEEVKEPSKNMPRAILLALAISTLLYMAVSVVAVLSAPPQQLAVSDAPLALLYRLHTQQPATVISIIGLFSILNGVLIQLIMASRVVYGMSIRNWLPGWLGYVHPVTRTPLIATVIITLVIWVLALGFHVEALARATSFVTLMIFTLMHAALWRIKISKPDVEVTVSYPLWVPIAGFFMSFGFLLTQLLQF